VGIENLKRMYSNLEKKTDPKISARELREDELIF
jgi:hypothetical protein